MASYEKTGSVREYFTYECEMKKVELFVRDAMYDLLGETPRSYLKGTKGEKPVQIFLN